MPYRLIMLPFFFVLLLSFGCSEDSDEISSDCETPGERTCENTRALECSVEYEWETAEDCSDSDRACENGQCISPSEFRATRLPVPGELQVDLPSGLECGQSWLIPFFASRQDETTDYEIGFGAAEKLRTSPESFTHLSMSFDGANSPLPARLSGQWAFDRYNRQRTEFLWENRGQARPEIQRRSLPMASDCTKSAECGTDEICNAGHCASSATLVFDAWSISTTLTAGVAAKGTRCAILLDEADTASVSQSTLDDLLDACENVIVPRSRLFFGKPEFTVDGQRQDVSDRDGDGLLQVLVSSKVNEENVWGFFASADFFDNETDYPSNERDIVYISVPEDASEIPVIQATIIHEYQHLLHFAGHAWGPWISGNDDADMSPVWLDEAMAHLSEEIGGYGVDNILLVNEVLKVINTTSLSFGEDDLMRRGMGLMFMLYLFEQAGGVEYSAGSVADKGGAQFLQALIFSGKNGFEAVEEAVGGDWNDFLFDWLVTVAVDGTGATDDPKYNYLPVIADPDTGHEIGIETNGVRQNPYNNYADLELTGPRCLDLAEPLSGSLEAMGVNYIRVDASLAGSSIRVEGPETDLYLGIVSAPAPCE